MELPNPLFIATRVAIILLQQATILMWIMFIEI